MVRKTDTPTIRAGEKYPNVAKQIPRIKTLKKPNQTIWKVTQGFELNVGVFKVDFLCGQLLISDNRSKDKTKNTPTNRGV